MALVCYGCGLPYSSSHFCDVLIPNRYWNAIAPERGTDEEGGAGVLCFNCMSGKLAAQGFTDVPMSVRSGPWRGTQDPLGFDLREEIGGSR